MRADARVKWRFQRSAVSLSLRDGSKRGNSVVFRCRASLRDAILLTLRLPRRYAPRNDTKLGRFCLENGRFSFMRLFFCAVSLRIVVQTFRSGNCSVFPKNLPNLSLRGGRVRPTWQSLTNRFAIPERTMVGRNETEPWNEERGLETKRRISFFAIGILFCFALPCFATGCHTFGFKIATSLRSSQ